MSSPFYWQDAKVYLSTRDEVLASLINKYPQEALTNFDNPFQTLIRAVVGQQISLKAADSIWLKLRQILPAISPNDFLIVSEQELKQCGLSRQKLAYMTNIANAFEQGILTPNQWQNMSDKEVIKQLIQIKGVGQWTAEMFLIFHLHRSDIFPLSDIGLINAFRLHYGDLTKEEIGKHSEKWKPYRTVATWYLWLSLDSVTVQY